MKIGIITFHWAANHGAVLQCYALSEYLKIKYSAEVEIINYYPKNVEISIINALKKVKPWSVMKKLKEMKKEHKIVSFRKNLNLTKRYYLNDELIQNHCDYDILITGSDQIWNPYYLMCGEKKITPVYFLNFNNTAKKISVSASFGCEKYPIECQNIVKPLLEKFADISVRESTGKEILQFMGFNAQVTADPTALLSETDYNTLCSCAPQFKGKISKLILRKQTKEIKEIVRCLCKAYSTEQAVNINYLSIPEWLVAIRDSKMVVTNSFHCVMMCLKFHTPFVVILENGSMSGMNDRFITLLNEFDLTDRIVNCIADAERDFGTIDFEKVEHAMERYTKTLKEFLDKNIV